MNNLKTDTIRAGQVLKISPNENVTNSPEKKDNATKTAQKSKITNKILSAADVDKLGTNKYIVIKGDNLHSIARKNNINVAKLVELNNIAGNGKINPGQILVVK